MTRTVFTSNTDAVLVEQDGPWRVYPHGLSVDAWYVPSREEGLRCILRALGNLSTIQHVEFGG